MIKYNAAVPLPWWILVKYLWFSAQIRPRPKRLIECVCLFKNISFIFLLVTCFRSVKTRTLLCGVRSASAWFTYIEGSSYSGKYIFKLCCWIKVNLLSAVTWRCQVTQILSNTLTHSTCTTYQLYWHYHFLRAGRWLQRSWVLSQSSTDSFFRHPAWLSETKWKSTSLLSLNSTTVVLVQISWKTDEQHHSFLLSLKIF